MQYMDSFKLFIISHLLLCGMIPKVKTSRATTPTPTTRISTRTLPEEIRPKKQKNGNFRLLKLLYY